MAAVLGVFSGASVNMPSLGAATQTLGTIPNITPDRLALPLGVVVGTPPISFAPKCWHLSCASEFVWNGGITVDAA